METAGFALTVVIGLLVGLFGGGGSILTVPVLVYLFAVPAAGATTYSLALVSITSLVAAVPSVRQKKIAYQKTLQFGIPSLIALYTVRAYVLPAIPLHFDLWGCSMEKNTFTMLFFSALMLASGIFMIRKKKNNTECPDCRYNPFVLMGAGLLEGLITGIVGAGGGFIIVPVLMVFGKLSLKQAVANSLVIIGVKSFIGFLGSPDLSGLDLFFLAKIVLIASVGMYLGIKLNKKLDSQQLKPVFGYFIILMGVAVLLKELVVN